MKTAAKSKMIECIRLGGFAHVTVWDTTQEMGIPTVELTGSVEELSPMLPDAAERLGLALIFAAKSARR